MGEMAKRQLNEQSLHAEVSSTGVQNNASRMQHLMEILPAGIVVLDGNGIVREANPIALEMLGEPLIGQPWRHIISRAFSPQADDGHEISLASGRRVKLALTALSPEPGQLILMTDLTETRELQNRISHLQRLSALGKMVASLAHQVRTPLSAAMLYAANLGNNTLTTENRGAFHLKLLARLQDLEQQVNDMLLFARSDSQIAATPLSMKQLLSDLQSRVEAMVSKSRSQLQIELPEPDIEILGNASSLASAISNLVHNSLQASATNIHVSAKRQQQMVAIEIRDNGKGIPEAMQKKVLEPFFTSRSQGTGLGLAVVQAVASAHKGSVSLVSGEGQGTCVQLLIPIRNEDELSAEVPLKEAWGG
ncbi:PAS domain-containing protein [Corallincola luteus]|uniref:histidine kinase n=4 Tax=Psychromonadaceae TaxID=267894 RepID=A0A368N3A0_9GAMM|nr:PAS domain-containing protein [Corallincola holothuriorum]TAA40399.1 PAS domain-containing protein [Corallincola spongiicola]TCI05661.1 PAS domain-containing protein [Corallincola luteus]